MFTVCSKRLMTERIEPMPQRERPSERTRVRLAAAVTLPRVIAEGFALESKCNACGRARVFAPEPLHDLAAALGWPTDLMSLSGRLRCDACGERRAELRAVDKPPADAPIGPTSVQAYRALLWRLIRQLRRR